MSPAKITLVTTSTPQVGLKTIAIFFLDDTVFTACDGLSLGDSTLADATFPKGATLFGQFPNITLASGACVIYETGF